MAKSKTPRGTYTDIKILALAAVESPDLAYFERHVARVFSVTFHVSLLETENIPLEYMLQHIFEYRFEQQKLGDRVIEAQELLRTPEERAEAEKKALADLDNDEVYLIRAASEELVKAKPKVPAPKLPDPPPDLPALKFDSEPDPK